MSNEMLGGAFIGAGVLLFCILAGYLLAAIFGGDDSE